MCARGGTGCGVRSLGPQPAGQVRLQVAVLGLRGRGVSRASGAVRACSPAWGHRQDEVPAMKRSGVRQHRDTGTRVRPLQGTRAEEVEVADGFLKLEHEEKEGFRLDVGTRGHGYVCGVGTEITGDLGEMCKENLQTHKGERTGEGTPIHREPKFGHHGAFATLASLSLTAVRPSCFWRDLRPVPAPPSVPRGARRRLTTTVPRPHAAEPLVPPATELTCTFPRQHRPLSRTWGTPRPPGRHLRACPPLKSPVSPAGSHPAFPQHPGGLTCH